MEKSVKEKLSGYLLDVSKYVLTAVLIATSFTDMISHRLLAYSVAAVIVIISLFWACFILKVRII